MMTLIPFFLIPPLEAISSLLVVMGIGLFLITCWRNIKRSDEDTSPDSK